MTKTHSFDGGIGRTILERVATPPRCAFAIATVAALLLASAAPAADVKILPPVSPAKCTLQDPDAPIGATARCRDGTYGFSQGRRGMCFHHLGVAEWVMRRGDGKCALDTAP